MTNQSLLTHCDMILMKTGNESENIKVPFQEKSHIGLLVLKESP